MGKTKVIHSLHSEEQVLADGAKTDVLPLDAMKDVMNQKHSLSEEDLQREYDFYMAEKLSKMMLETGLLTQEECNKLSVKNRETFYPYLSELMPKSA